MLLLPTEYALMDTALIKNKIKEIKKQFGKDLVILAHHYQGDDIIEMADFTGDSFGLSKIGSEQKEASKIVFCGVNFMAESAKILASPMQTVYLPNNNAGCPLADFADILDVKKAWNDIIKISKTDKIIPICYMNSSSEIKAFCGENNGYVCTSSNAEKIFKKAFSDGEKIFFIPDEHLGKNTANKMNISETIVWNPEFINGGNSEQSIKGAKVILWKGYCHVHAYWFKKEDIERVRNEYPGIKVVVHPECTEDVVDMADTAGSTAFIIEYVKNAHSGSIIAIGTELNLVKRVHDEFEGEKTIIPLKRSVCPNMMKISLAHLLFCLENIDKEDFKVNVSEDVIHNAKLALQRMLG